MNKILAFKTINQKEVDRCIQAFGGSPEGCNEIYHDNQQWFDFIPAEAR